MEVVTELDVHEWHPAVSAGVVTKLEAGSVLVASDLDFDLTAAERQFLSPGCVDGSAKQISYRPASGTIHGTSVTGDNREQLTGMVRRYYEQCSALLRSLVPEYEGRLTPGFTSFRPVEIAGRKTAWRKDDTRLHIDAFPSRPMRGLRILRIFTNIHRSEPRHWRVGGCFEDVAERFWRQVRREVPGTSWLLQWLHITKGRRTPYDHFMLGIHDRMKADDGYQNDFPHTDLRMKPGTTWVCFTDAVPHAAMAGQFALEQTFYLPVDAMQEPKRSPLRVLERLTGRALV